MADEEIQTNTLFYRKIIGKIFPYILNKHGQCAGILGKHMYNFIFNFEIYYCLVKESKL